MSDPQCKAVYLMEAREFQGMYRHVCQPLKYLRSLARMACKFYQVPPVRLRTKTLRGASGEMDVDNGVLTLGRGPHDQNVFTLAHELAHHIAWQRHGHRVQDHGPTFVLLFGQVLSSLRVVPMSGMRAACKRHGVRIARWK